LTVKCIYILLKYAVRDRLRSTDNFNDVSVHSNNEDMEVATGSSGTQVLQLEQPDQQIQSGSSSESEGADDRTDQYGTTSCGAEVHESTSITMTNNLNDYVSDAMDVFYECENETTAAFVNSENINEEQQETTAPNVLESENSAHVRTETVGNRTDYDPLVGGDGNVPIFTGLTCTKGQLVSLVLAFYLRFPNTKESLQGLLQLLDAIIPNCIRSTKYFFDRYFFGGLESFDTHYVCPLCFLYIGQNDTNYCNSCKKNI
jgi:hypothetical protein